MANLSDTLGTSVEIELSGKKYRAGRLTLADWAEFEVFAYKLHRAKIIKTAKEIYGETLPDSVLERATKPLGDGELEEYQASIAGLSFLF